MWIITDIFLDGYILLTFSNSAPHQNVECQEFDVTQNIKCNINSLHLSKKGNINLKY
jgi:hypothetical protein